MRLNTALAEGRLRPARTRRMAIVGNAPEIGDCAEAIDSADIVVRFNNAHGLGGVTGCKTTYLFLVNSGGQMREWLDDSRFIRRRSVRTAESIYLPIDPRHLDRFEPPLDAVERAGALEEDWTAEAIARLSRAGKQVQLVPAAAFAMACGDIGTRLTAGMAPPSTGYLATHYFMAKLARSGWRVEAYGFGFEGYSGHAWDAERSWFLRQAAKDRLTLVPLGVSRREPAVPSRPIARANGTARAFAG